MTALYLVRKDNFVQEPLPNAQDLQIRVWAA